MVEEEEEEAEVEVKEEEEEAALGFEKMGNLVPLKCCLEKLVEEKVRVNQVQIVLLMVL